MAQQTNLEEMVIKSQGLKGLKNTAITSTVLYGLRKIKTHFGVDMRFTEYSQVQAAIGSIQKDDNDFKNHIANP